MLNTLFLRDLCEDETFSAMVISGTCFDLPSDASLSFLQLQLSYYELADCNRRYELYCVACCATGSELCGILLAYSKKHKLYYRVGSFHVDMRYNFSEANSKEVEQEDGDDDKDDEGGEDETDIQNDEDDGFRDLKEQSSQNMVSDTIQAIGNALKDGSQAGYSLPCDFYDEKNRLYNITIR